VSSLTFTIAQRSARARDADRLGVLRAHHRANARAVDVPRPPVATNAAYECGDLRIAHTAPSLRVRNDDRTPVLLYNTAHGEPRPVLLANLSAPAGGATGVTAKLTIRRGDSDVQVVDPTPFPNIPGDSTRRIALTYDASGDTTGIYPYTFTVTMTVGGSPQTLTASDTLVVVNRKASPFGAGWWVAGYEQLVPLPGRSLLWVGGDGSTRRYAPDSTNPGVFRTLGLDRPDSLTLPGSTYVRMLRHRAQVQFDLSGRHVATIDPLNSTTTFQHDGAGRLQSIIYPTASQPRHAFFYSAGGLLDSLTGPGPVSGTRRITLFHGSGGRVERITDADGVPVTFGFPTPTGLVITSRTNRNVARKRSTAYVPSST
jgi:YD repeat-containing protein